MRTDVSFNAFEDEDHHKDISPLVELNIGMVSQFPQNYMHLVCLGVVKRLLLLWKKGPLRYRLGSQDLNQISDSMLSLKGYVPCEYSSKPRSLDVIDRCKAAEFRQFLLYTGPQVLLNVVHRNIYNFLLQCIYCKMRVCAIFTMRMLMTLLLPLFLTLVRPGWGKKKER